MLVTAAVVAASTTAYAATAGAKVAQGAYLGAGAGAANTNVKYTRNASGAMTAGIDSITSAGSNAAAETHNLTSDAGKTAGIFGLIAGYNFQSGSVVFGGEIYGGFDSTKVAVHSDAGSGSSTQTANFGSLTVKRTNFMGFAPRIGFMLAPNTLMYARLGVEFGKWKATNNPNATAIDAGNTMLLAITGAPSSTDLANSKTSTSASKGGMSFAPGLGMEVYMGKAFLRAQYSYLFGPKITLQQNMKGVKVFNGEFANHTMKLTQHKVELAVGYKF